MSTQVIPFPAGSLPAYLKGKTLANADLMTGVASGFDVLSIKGKVWAVIKEGERKVITKPDEPDEPASSIEVVILKANPNQSKSYYSGAFEEGAGTKPTCFSNDGKAPDTTAITPQSKTCATCKHNIWGSGTNGKGRACRDARLLAVAPAGHLDRPMLLRVPPASLKNLAEYARHLTSHGAPYNAIITRLRFDPAEATPKLLFTAKAFLSNEQFVVAENEAKSDLVSQIVGLAPVPQEDGDVFEKGVPVAEVKAAAAKIPVVEDDAPEVAPEPPKVTRPRTVRAAPAPAPEPTPAPSKASMDDDIDAMLAEFDD